MYKNIGNLNLIGSGDMDYYKQNVSVTTYMPDGTAYVITINDWAAIAGLYNTYLAMTTVFNANFQSDALAYQLATGNGDGGISGSWALIERFGSSISIFKSAPGSAILVPLVRSSSNYFLVVEKGCP